MTLRSFGVYILLAAAAATFAYCSGRRDGAASVRHAELKAAVDSALETRAALVETVTVHAPGVREAAEESDRLARVVTIAGPTTVEVRTTPSAPVQIFTVPPEVVDRMRADSVTIARQAAQLVRYELLTAADSLVIDRQAVLIGELEGRRCGRTCGIVIGAIGTVGALVVLDKARDAWR